MSLPLLSEIASQGVYICVDGDNLTVNRDNLTDSLLAKIKDEKPSLIASLERLSGIAGDDWQEIVNHPDQVRDLIHSFVTTEARERGEIPAHYTAVVYCQTCNQDVPHFPVNGDAVEACVWCMNGKPVLVSDVGCTNYTEQGNDTGHQSVQSQK